MDKTACIFGASGLTGSILLHKLLASDDFTKVFSFGRRKLDVEHPKLEQHLADYDSIDEFSGQVKADVLFCCLGTTIKKAGSKEMFRKIDLHYPEKLVRFSEQNNIKQFIVISSIGANAMSANFYLQTKGMMEQALLDSSITNKTILRPSLIMGNRNEFRMGENIAVMLMKAMGWLLIGSLKKYRGIPANIIAEAMLLLSLQDSPPLLMESSEIKLLVKNKMK